jgi:preprotein translocase subunit SecF
LDPLVVYTLFFILLLLLAGGEELESIRSILSFAISSGVAFLITLAWIKLWAFINKFK